MPTGLPAPAEPGHSCRTGAVRIRPPGTDVSPTPADPFETLARLLTAEAAWACSSLPGAIVVATAGCITGEWNAPATLSGMTRFAPAAVSRSAHCASADFSPLTTT